jgi:hypothetical protein
MPALAVATVSQEQLVALVEEAEKYQDESLPRGIASEVLAAIANETAYGAYPQEIPPELFGRAVARTIMNYNGPLEGHGSDHKANLIRQFMKGFLGL